MQRSTYKIDGLRFTCYSLFACVGLFGAMPARAETVATPQAAVEKLPAGLKIVRLEALPAKIELKHPYDAMQILLTGVAAGGERVDVTRLARVAAPPLIELSPRGLVRPKADGTGTLTFTVEGQTVAVPVAVSGQKAPHAVSYVREVGPVLSKLGCNQGTCHGSAQGKNGFKLSLRGYDPLYDHRALTDDLAARRFNRAAPDQSVMLLKPTGAVPHQGGVLMHPGEPSYELLRDWIAQGVKLDLDSPRVAKIEVLPRNPLLPLPGVKQQMLVMATYTNGVVRDVTAEAFLESSLAEVVEVDKQGLATAVRRGEAAILARYEGAYAATTIVVMGDRTGYAWQEVPENNHIDTLVYKKLRKVKILPSDVCTDAEFVRRLYLDLTGLPPTADDVRAFMADPRETRIKRDALIDRLVGSPDFVEQWTNKWADLLQVNRKFLGEQGAWAYRNWIRQAVSNNMPYDQFVNSILTADGSTLDNPPASYYKTLRAPGDTMENTTQLFLAVRFNCNKCHDHPFERWTQDQYYQMAAYFAQVGRKPAPEFADVKLGGTAVEQALPAVEVVYDTGAGEVTHDRTGQITPPKFPYAHGDLALPTASRRAQLARWVTSKDNQYFAKSYVNRIWSYLLGTGIIEPIDDIRAGNPPSNPELLDRLTQDFIDSGFNVQLLFRTICKSRTYQHSIVTNQWNQDDEINYSHGLARRLSAETLYDSLHRVTGTEPKLPGVPAGFRASQLPDSTEKLSDGFLELFGRPPRESACECERNKGVMLGQALNLVNGPTMADAVGNPNNHIGKLVNAESDDRKVVEDLFLTILSRPPTAAEITTGIDAIRGYNDEPARIAADKARFEKDVLTARANEWAKTQRLPAEWTPLELAAVASTGATFTRQPDGSLLVGGKNGNGETITLVAQTPLENLTGLRLEALADPSLPGKGPGRAGQGNFVVSELRCLAVSQQDPSKSHPVAFETATADFGQASYGVAGIIDGDFATGWAIAPQVGTNHAAVLQTKGTAGYAGGTTLVVTIFQRHPKGEFTLGRFRLSATGSPRPVVYEAGPAAPPAIIAIATIEPAKRTPQQQADLVKHYATLDAEYGKLVQAAAEAAKNTNQYRLKGAQDLAWALINSPAFLFNR